MKKSDSDGLLARRALRAGRVVDRFKSLSKDQPLASPNKIIDFIAADEGLSATGVRYILKKAGIKTNNIN